MKVEIKTFNTFCKECMKHTEKQVLDYIGYCETHKLDLYKLYCDNCVKFNENDRFFKGRKPIRFEMIDIKLYFDKSSTNGVVNK